MSLLAPLFLLGAAAAIVPIVLHLFKRQPEARLKFAAVKLLKGAPVEHAQRRRLRELLLLALRVAALLLLAFAFARPFVPSGSQAASAGLTIVALDRSFSLSAPGSFGRAREAARNAIAAAPSNHVVAVLTFDHTAAVVAPPSGDRVGAAAAVDAASPGFGGTSYRVALAAAADLIANHAGSEANIVVVTDLQESGWDQGDQVALQDFAMLSVVDVGEGPSNLAVTGVRSAGTALIATVRNWGSEPREARLALHVDERAGGAATTALGPNEQAEVSLPMPSGIAASVTVEDSDGLQADNTRYLVTDNTAMVIMVVTATGDLPREAFYVEQALGSTGSGHAFDIQGVAASELSSLDTERASRLAAVVLLTTRGLDARGRELLSGYLTGGGGLLIAAGPEVDGLVIAETLDQSVSIETTSDTGRPGSSDARSLVPGDLRHPVFQPFGAGVAALGLVTFARIATVRADTCQTLARFTTGQAALVDCAAGQGRALVFASDLDNRWNDFPVHATYVPFVHEVLRYLAGTRSRAGEYLVGEAPVGVPNEPGVTRVTDQAGRPHWVAVNVDPDESNPARLRMDEFEATVTRLQDDGRTEARIGDRQTEERQHLWQYVLSLMIIMMVLESFVGARTA